MMRYIRVLARNSYRPVRYQDKKNLLRSDFHPKIHQDIPPTDHEIAMFTLFLRVLTI